MIDLYTWPTPNGHKIHIMLEETGVAPIRSHRRLRVVQHKGGQRVLRSYPHTRAARGPAA